MSESRIVLTDAPEPAAPKVAKACPRHPSAPVIAANIAETHGICSKCGFEPLELPR